MAPDTSKLNDALASLEEGLKAPPRNDLERDGVIQRFEFTFEMAWKTGRKFLDLVGLQANSPREALRLMGQQGWLEVELWFAFLEARNSVTHIYDKRIAEAVYERAQAFAPECRRLLDVLVKVK